MNLPDARIEATGEDSCILYLSGRLDASLFHELDQALEDLFARGMKFVTIDLSALEHMSSSCMGVLMMAHLRAGDFNGRIHLVNVPDAVRENLEMLNLWQSLCGNAPPPPHAEAFPPPVTSHPSFGPAERRFR